MHNNFSTLEAKHCVYFYYRISVQIKLHINQHYGSNYPDDFIPNHLTFSRYSLIDSLNIVKERYLAISKWIMDQKANRANRLAEDICRYIDNN